ncbi:MAG: DUF934 domain-containing protein [Betaproteobacteria bacterium]|nr:DUF934 domain-containing protein [Betaproteobacteria bacterium]
MPVLIKNRALQEDDWHVLAADVEEIPARGSVLVPLARWQILREAVPEGGRRIGVVLDTGDDPHVLAPDLHQLPVVAVHFPSFTDGRGYSIARLLRERHGYAGELRAVGDVLRDQLFLLARCGFDAFALRADQDPAAALAAFTDFSEAYQAAVDRGALFERRFRTEVVQ